MGTVDNTQIYTNSDYTGLPVRLLSLCIAWSHYPKNSYILLELAFSLMLSVVAEERSLFSRIFPGGTDQEWSCWFLFEVPNFVLGSKILDKWTRHQKIRGHGTPNVWTGTGAAPSSLQFQKKRLEFWSSQVTGSLAFSRSTYFNLVEYIFKQDSVAFFPLALPMLWNLLCMLSPIM